MDKFVDWSEWILQKNQEAEQEELKKSDSVTIESGAKEGEEELNKIWAAGMVGAQGTHAARQRQVEAKRRAEGREKVKVVNQENRPKKGETREQHAARVGARLREKFPEMADRHKDVINAAWAAGIEQD